MYHSMAFLDSQYIGLLIEVQSNVVRYVLSFFSRYLIKLVTVAEPENVT